MSNSENATIRRPKIRIEVDRWDWEKGYQDTINITNAIMSYNWQKTIKSPSGGATLHLLPQTQFQHLLDDIAIMDVVKIFEFDVLKFQGYIRRLGTSGKIDPDGAPHRAGSFQCTTFGGFLIESIISIDMDLIRGEIQFVRAAKTLAKDISKAGEDGLSFNEIVASVIDVWLDFIAATTESTIYINYFKRYIDFTTGMFAGDTPGYPKEMHLFKGTEEEINLWSIIEKLAEVPLNEFFFDEGPRSVHIDGVDVELSGSLTYLIGRPTPFDTIENKFQAIKPVTIPRSHLFKYDLNKSMDEVFSLYITAPVITDPSKRELLAEGKVVRDDIAYGKYLYRLCNKPLYYLNMIDHADNKKGSKYSNALIRAEDISEQLYWWYKNNDQFLSGTLEYMVPMLTVNDPRIGDKIAIEGVEGYFYAEGISHNWNYQGPLKGIATVTRGWNDEQPIRLRDRIFKKPKNSYWNLNQVQERR